MKIHLFATLCCGALTLLAAACASGPEAVTVPLLSDVQKSYQLMPREERIAYFASPEKRKLMGSTGFQPLKVYLELPMKKGEFTVRENPDRANAYKKHDFKDISVIAPRYALVSIENGKVALQNLKIATRYEWSMGTGEDMKSGAVYTEDLPPRLMRIHGVPNARDLGGRIGLGGHRVKQGLIYRTGGMNENAKRVKAIPEEEYIKMDLPPAREYAQLLKDLDDLAVKFKKSAKEEPPAGTMPYFLNDEWTVFRSEKTNPPLAELLKAASWQTPPAEFLGVKGEKVHFDRFCNILFPGEEPYRPAVFFKTFDSPEEGLLNVGFGADWFFRLFVNGEMIYDCLDLPDEQGNEVWPPSVTNRQRNIKIRKGKNVIVLVMLSGAGSFSCAFGPCTKWNKDIDAKLARVRYLKMWEAWTFAPGANRMLPTTRDYVANDLGIRTDIDLRWDMECYCMTGSPIGKKTAWIKIPSQSYDGMAEKEGKEAFAKVFRVLLNEKNYPLVFHCIAGQDRTGAVAFILNGLLGVKEEQLFLDWESTGYWNEEARWNHETQFNKLYKVFDAYPGKTINERIEAYVLGLGITKKEIEHFRDIMLEKD